MKMVIFHRFLYVYQRVNHKFMGFGLHVVPYESFKSMGRDILPPRGKGGRYTLTMLTT
jgi:hypothetical protein